MTRKFASTSSWRISALVKELGDATGERVLPSPSLTSGWQVEVDDKKVRIYNLEDFCLVKELGDATGSVTFRRPL